MHFSQRVLVAFFLLVVAGLVGALWGGYLWGKQVGQGEGYAWGMRKGRVEAARQLPQPAIDRKHSLESLQETSAFAPLAAEDPERLQALADLLNRAPSPCLKAAKKGVSLATALVQAPYHCPAFAEGQVRLAWAALNSLDDPQEALAALRVERRATIDIAGRSTKGAADAPIVVVEWSDFECPYCRRAGPLMDLLIKRRPGVRVVYKHLPLSFHKAAFPAALAVEAAAEQGQFWAMHDALFDLGRSLGDAIDPDQPVPIEGPVPYETQAENLGLDLDRYRRDFRSEVLHGRIEGDVEEAQRLGVRGTPTLFVDGRRVEEGMGIEVLVRLVDKAMGEREGRFSWDLQAPSRGKTEPKGAEAEPLGGSKAAAKPSEGQGS